MPGIRSIASPILADALALQACPCFSEPERAFITAQTEAFLKATRADSRNISLFDGSLLIRLARDFSV
jgi:hypothetical protein